MHDANQEWSWVSEDGIEHPVSENELAFALSAEEIPAYALVWKSGWAEWLPAMQVAELQWALPPGRADGPRKAALSDDGVRKPPPLDRYPELKQRATDLVAGRVSPHQEPLLAASSPSSAPLPRRETTPKLARITSPDRNSVPFTREDEEELTVQIDGEELERGRLNSLLEVDFDASAVEDPPAPQDRPRVRSTLESHDAVPRRMPGSLAERLRSHTSNAPPAGSAPSYPAPPVTSAPSYPAPPVTSAPSYPAPPVASTPSYPAPPVGSAPSYASAPSRPPLSSPAPSKPASDPPLRPRKSSMPIVAVLGALACGALAALWLRFGRHTPTPPPRTAAPVAESVEAPKPRLAQCKLGRPGSMLAEWAYPKIEPGFAGVSGGTKLAVGYAQTSRYAVGLTLDPATLRAEKVFSEFQNSPLLSVVPLTSGTQLGFRPTRAAATLQSATTIDAKVPFALGWTREGFGVRRDTDSVDQLQWRSTFSTANVPSVAKLTEDLFTFTLRAGGERGNILLGKVRSSADAVGELSSLKLPDGRVGLPVMRVGPTRVLVAFTVGATDVRGDVYVAESKKPQLPTTARSVLHVAEGVFSPTAVELTNDSFLLQFSRGEPGNQQVVAQVYDYQFNKSGPEFLVSPKDLDAHAGALWTIAGHVLSLYMVRTDQAYALWATRLDCE
jgi:GYF domain 2